MVDELTDFEADSPEIPDIPGMTRMLESFQEEIEKTRSALPHGDALPLDPLTGQPITKLPGGVQISPYAGYRNDFDQDPREGLAGQLYHIEEVKLLIKEVSEQALYKRRRAEQERVDESQARLEARFHAGMS